MFWPKTPLILWQFYPTKHKTCLGIDVNINDQANIDNIHDKCLVVHGKNIVIKHFSICPVETIIYVQKCVKPTRVFINKIFGFLGMVNKNLHWVVK